MGELKINEQSRKRQPTAAGLTLGDLKQTEAVEHTHAHTVSSWLSLCGHNSPSVSGVTELSDGVVYEALQIFQTSATSE